MKAFHFPIENIYKCAADNESEARQHAPVEVVEILFFFVFLLWLINIQQDDSKEAANHAIKHRFLDLLAVNEVPEDGGRERQHVVDGLCNEHWQP